MDFKKHIKDNYGSQYRFCIEKKLQPSKVSYWCSKDWKMLNYNTRVKICDYLKIDVC